MKTTRSIRQRALCCSVRGLLNPVVFVDSLSNYYIDDFVVLGPPDSKVCSNNLFTLSQTCSELGVILAKEKTEGPATCLTVLGIKVAMELRLPPEKLTQLVGLLEAWHGRKTSIRHDLESLVGMLQHASKVVHPGRIFLRRIYDILAATSHFKPHFTVRLNRTCRADIDWCHKFIHSWNGTSLLRQVHTLTPDVHLWSDASGHWGCSAHCQGLWFNLPWGSLPIATKPIAGKELFPILIELFPTATTSWWSRSSIGKVQRTPF